MWSTASIQMWRFACFWHCNRERERESTVGWSWNLAEFQPKLFRWMHFYGVVFTEMRLCSESLGCHLLGPFSLIAGQKQAVWGKHRKRESAMEDFLSVARRWSGTLSSTWHCFTLTHTHTHTWVHTCPNTSHFSAQAALRDVWKGDNRNLFLGKSSESQIAHLRPNKRKNSHLFWDQWPNILDWEVSGRHCSLWMEILIGWVSYVHSQWQLAISLWWRIYKPALVTNVAAMLLISPIWRCNITPNIPSLALFEVKPQFQDTGYHIQPCAKLPPSHSTVFNTVFCIINKWSYCSGS